jgi:hypothetical protein
MSTQFHFHDLSPCFLGQDISMPSSIHVGGAELVVVKWEFIPQLSIQFLYKGVTIEVLISINFEIELEWSLMIRVAASNLSPKFHAYNMDMEDGYAIWKNSGHMQRKNDNPPKQAKSLLNTVENAMASFVMNIDLTH